MICLCILVHHFSIIAISEEQYIIYNISMKLKHIFLKNTSQNAPFEPIFHQRDLSLGGMQARGGSSRKLFKTWANRVIDCWVGSSWEILRFEFQANRVKIWVKKLSEFYFGTMVISTKINFDFSTMLMSTKNHLLWRFSPLVSKNLSILS